MTAARPGANDTPRLLAKGEFDLLIRRGIANVDVDACERERVLGVLADAVFGEGLPIRDDARRHLLHRLRRRAVSTVALDSRCAVAIELFRANGIECRVLKGAAVARLDYDRTELPHYGHIDPPARGEDSPEPGTRLEQPRCRGPVPGPLPAQRAAGAPGGSPAGGCRRSGVAAIWYLSQVQREPDSRPRRW